jgi:predicted anti-sigma-YlaC factor YlaD
MKCKDIKKLISLYIDGEISLEKKKELEMHIKNCISCKKELEDMEKLIQEIHKIPKIDSSPNFSERLWYRYQMETEEKSNYKRKICIVLGIALTFLFLFLLSQKIWINKSEPDKLQTFYEIHGKWKKPSMFEEPSIDFVLLQVK